MFCEGAAPTKMLVNKLYEENNWNGSDAYQRWLYFKQQENFFHRLYSGRNDFNVGIFVVSVYNLTTRSKSLSRSGRSLAWLGAIYSFTMMFPIYQYKNMMRYKLFPERFNRPKIEAQEASN